jgi:hypothetical protein
MDKRTELALELGQTIYKNTINDLQARLNEKEDELEALKADMKVTETNFDDWVYNNYSEGEYVARFDVWKAAVASARVMGIVKHLSKLPSFVEYQGCVFILCFGREVKKDSDKADGISLWYRLDSVDITSPHWGVYNQCGSWLKPDYGLCNFLVLYEYVNSDEGLLKRIDEIEQYLIGLGIEL